MYEDRNGTDIYYYYDSYGTPVSIRYYEPDGTSHRFFLATNQLGDIIGIYNASGNLVVKYEYDAWGNIIAETNATGGTPTSLAQYWSDINPFRYRGYYYDAETELYYLQSRYYDPEVGRFLNADMYYIFEPSLLEAELMSAVIKSGVQVDLSFVSAYAMSINGNTADTYISDIAEAVIFLPIAFELYNEQGISTHYLNYGTTDIDVEVFYQVPESEDAVIRVTITAKGEKHYDELISKDYYYQTIYETVFYIGTWNAWSMYHMTSVSSREKNYNILGKMIEFFGVILSVASLLYPNSELLFMMSALSTVTDVRNGLADSLSWFEEANISRFDKYIYKLLLDNYETDVIKFLFSVIDRSIEYANQREDIKYKVKL